MRGKGWRIAFSPGAKPVYRGMMFGFLKEKDGQIAVVNRIFEMWMLSMFMKIERTSCAWTTCLSLRTALLRWWITKANIRKRTR